MTDSTDDVDRYDGPPTETHLGELLGEAADAWHDVDQLSQRDDEWQQAVSKCLKKLIDAMEEIDSTNE